MAPPPHTRTLSLHPPPTHHHAAYEADGAVLKLDDLALWARLGAADRDPRWALALKFPAAEAVAALEGVEWAVGRTGHVSGEAAWATREGGVVA